MYLLCVRVVVLGAVVGAERLDLDGTMVVGSAALVLGNNQFVQRLKFKLFRNNHSKIFI